MQGTKIIEKPLKIVKDDQEVLISIKGLTKIYGDDKKHPVKAVDNLSFDIYKGETFGLVGESGCGKSTLGQILTLLNPATQGNIEFEKMDIAKVNKKTEKQLRRKIQIIFQDPYSSIDPKKKIGWLIEEPLVIHKIGDKAKREDLVNKILKVVGLDESYKSRWPFELSGGQRQRVAIAIALILNPSFVVCDEAVSALDVSVQAQVLNLLKDLQKEIGLTYLFISHNLNVVSYMSDRIGVMYLGSFVELGTAQQLSENPLHPYTQALFSASLSVGEQEKQRIVLKGDLPSPSNPPAGCPFHSRCPQCQDICTKERPQFKSLADGRFCACHFCEN